MVKKGASESELPSEASVTKLMAIEDRFGLPVAVRTESASPHEVQLIRQTVASGSSMSGPKR